MRVVRIEITLQGERNEQDSNRNCICSYSRMLDSWKAHLVATLFCFAHTMHAWLIGASSIFLFNFLEATPFG